jgi:hypothetical protein
MPTTCPLFRKLTIGNEMKETFEEYIKPLNEQLERLLNDRN